jgi:hypothetical protein
MKFTGQQQVDYQAGSKRRARLKFMGQTIKNVDATDTYPHYYIYSKPGLGKTHTITEALNDSKHYVYHMSAAESMFIFGIHLAVLNYNVPKSQTIMVVLDDAENLLGTTENINIFKNMLDGSRSYKYSKKLDSILSSMPDEIQEAVSAHTKSNEIGFTVPTSRFCFVFTSNIKLPEYADLNRRMSAAKTTRTMHLLAIRDRVRPVEFDLNEMEIWGWIADTVLTEKVCSETPEEVVLEALNFTYENWDSLKTKSIRLIQQMCDEYKQHPDNYKTIWEMDYI